nr:hypothetical protein [uncultured Draconibacterium sp.]
MKYQEKFELNSVNAEYFGKKIDVFITSKGSANKVRSEKIKEHISVGFKGFTIVLDSNRDQDKFSASLFNNLNENIENLSETIIIPNLRRFFKQQNYFNIEVSNICIDITSMPHVLIFNLCKLFIKETKPRNLFATYTEPRCYIKKIGVKTDSCLEDEDYDLYEEILGLNYNIDGFAKIKRIENDLLVASLGFEKQRLLALYDKIEPKGGLRPIVGFPSFNPGWNITAINMNNKVIEDANAEGYIESCESSSPFAIYSELKKIHEKNSDKFNIMIAPFGTRPNCLGATIFALKHKGCQLLYDFPIEKNFRSEGADSSYFYILSSFLID